jgi:hypothetical protein
VNIVGTLHSGIALLLAVAVWISLSADATPSLRAAVVLLFLTTPGIVVSRFLRGLEPVSRAVVAVASIVVVWAAIAQLTLAAKVWAPVPALLAVAALVGVVSVVDLCRRFARRRADLR